MKKKSTIKHFNMKMFFAFTSRQIGIQRVIIRGLKKPRGSSMIKKLLKMIQKKPGVDPLNEKRTELNSGYYPVHSAAPLLEPHRAIISTMRQYFGVPGDIWKSVHESLLMNYARRVQLLPISEDEPEPGGLLKLSLESANHAMKIRRGYMLPNGAASERISEQTEIWNFAAFSAALLRNIEKPASEATISLINHKGDESAWSLVHGDIPFDESYHAKFNPQQPVQQSEPAPLLVAEQIIPQIAIEWLASYPDVNKIWRLTLSGQYVEAGTFGEIIRQIDHNAHPVAVSMNSERRDESHNPGNSPQASFSSESEIPQADYQNTILPQGMGNIQIRPDTSEANEHQNQSEPGKEAAEEFIKWLCQQINNKTIGINEPTSYLLVVAEGLLLVSPAIFEHYLQNKEHIELKMLQSGFFSLGIHKPLAHKHREPVWRYRYKGKNSDRVIRGILIPDPLTAFDLEELPEVNPLMSAELPKAENHKKPGASNDNIHPTTGRT
jgi:hypothetical protein